MSSDIITYLNSNQFIEHPMGNYALYGLNNFGCDSIIQYNDEIMKFYAFQSGSNNAIYISKTGNHCIINPYDNTLNITRLVDIKDVYDDLSYAIVSYLNSTKFVDHPFGNYALYGLNNLGCDSIIKYNDEIMKFYAFQSGSNNAIYITKSAKKVIIDPYDQTLNITRLVDIKDLRNFSVSLV